MDVVADCPLYDIFPDNPPEISDVGFTDITGTIDIPAAPLIRQEVEQPPLYGVNDPEVILVCWGSLYGITSEAVDTLSEDVKAAMLHCCEIYPFPLPLTEGFSYIDVLKNAKISICIEQNAAGQFARLFRAETGHECTRKINKYDGRPFTTESLIRELRAIIERQ